MTRDDIIRMARGATDHLSDADSIRLQGIVLLALDAGAAAEREACAKELEAIADRIPVEQREGFVYKTVIECVAAIRARGEKK